MTTTRRQFLASAVAGGSAVLLNLPIDAWADQIATAANNYAYQTGGSVYRAIALPTGNAEQITYVIRIGDVKSIENPGLVVLVDRANADTNGSVNVNGNIYPFPQSPAEMLAKVVVPLKPEHLQNGLNRISFPDSGRGTYQALDSQIQVVNESSAQVVGLSYLLRSAVPTLVDFDLIANYTGAGKRRKSDLPSWAKHGKIRFYRAGIDFNNLDRLFEMFKEARFNLVMLQTVTPVDLQSPEYKRYKDFIDRCHAAGIRVMFDGGTGAVRLNFIEVEQILLYPHKKEWLATDDLGFPRWRTLNRTLWANVKNTDYRKEVLKAAEIAVDSGAESFYYDWATGATGDLLLFFNDVREMTAGKGKNIPIYGNLKGNIIVEERCDFTKSEGTKEAGLWDGKWVHNVAQSRFYYAAGEGWKPYESKYEGDDPGRQNPGAYDLWNGMKMGWKRPIAEAAAFHSFFAIAEVSRPLLQSWIRKDDPKTMTAWNDICRYFNFLADHEDLYTDVRNVSNIGLVAPPVIPSAEVSLRRASLYDALVEMNFMYDVVLLSRLNEGSLAGYKAIVIPDMPWMDQNQLRVIQRYKQSGGQVLTVGSSEELKKTASTILPASLIGDIQKQPVRDEFRRALVKLSGEPLVMVQNADYVIANLARKQGSDKLVVHFLNYGPAVGSVNVKLNLAGLVRQINSRSLQLFSPDNVAKELKNVSVKGNVVTFTIPEIDIYDVVTIN